MATSNSYRALYSAYEYQPKNFQRTRNVPIDTSFLLESLNDLDEKIPYDIRYPGLIFFVKDATIFSGTVTNGKAELTNGNLTSNGKNITGLLYVFEEDLSKPKPLHDLIQRFEIRCIKETNYNNLNSVLNNLYAKSGNIILIDNLGISVICDYDGNWKYFSGEYIVESPNMFNSIPENLREPGITVYLTGINQKRIIDSNKQLSSEILTTTNPNLCTEDRRFYNINGYFYYRFGNTNIPISDKFVVKNNVKLNIGNNYITHNFNSKYVSVYGIINEHSENINNDYVNYCFPLEHIYENNNIIIIKSSVIIESIDLCIISKTHLTE